MNSENNNHIIIEVINNDGDIKLTKMRNPRAIWFDSNMPDDYVFADVDYINIFSLIQENKQLKERMLKIEGKVCAIYNSFGYIKDDIIKQELKETIKIIRFGDSNEN